MMPISLHFKRKEFACKCGCGFSTVDIELVRVLEAVRKRFKQPVNINSGCRCEEYNKEVGGSYGSKHKQGIAADIVVKNVKPKDVYNFLNAHEPFVYGLGLYSTFVHLDVRAKKARWQGDH